MVERRTLEDVLNDLKEAEKEYKEKCLKYGISEKHKRKKDDEVAENQEEETPNEEGDSSQEEINNDEEISEN